MRHLPIIIAALALLLSCRAEVTVSEALPPIVPDYVGVTVPEGIAALNFELADGCRFDRSEERVGDTLFITVTARAHGSQPAVKYRPFPVYFSKDSIDPYIAYRLIEPGYESWHDMGIYQRELASFKETPVVTNRSNGQGCLNCHSFPSGDPSRMVFHSRGSNGGTIFTDGDNVNLVNLAAVGPQKQGTYPAWHPDGRFIAFSSNTTRQCFTIDNAQPIEVYDTASDIILMDTQTGEVKAPAVLNTPDVLETFPTWSSDGSELFYCAADSVADPVADRGKVHYRLMKIGFDGSDVVGEPSVVIDIPDGSVSFPRVNGDWLLYTRSGFGTFPIWHKEADLWLLNLTGGETFPAGALNSDDTESYHSWSSNGKWLIFSSRRIDGRYTRLYISHFDGQGNFTKPFLLPQKSYSHNSLRLKSYNIPEFVTGKVANYDKATKNLFGL